MQRGEEVRGDAPGAVFEVHLLHNLLHAIRRVPHRAGLSVPASPLEVSSQLAANQQRNGCVDGCYLFVDAEQARTFAVLALDFVKRRLERQLAAVEALDSGAAYPAGGEDGAPR